MTSISESSGVRNATYENGDRVSLVATTEA
jgi:hypothetical protein